jgi:hypothetical protein
VIYLHSAIRYADRYEDKIKSAGEELQHATITHNVRLYGKGRTFAMS